MKKEKFLERIFIILMCLTLLFTGGVGPGVESLFSAGFFGIEKTAKAAGKSWPKLSKAKQKRLAAKSAILMDVSTGTVLFEKNMHTKHYPASITKILTAMLLAENASPNEIMTVSEKAAYGIHAGDSTVYSEPGEKLTIEECLYAIMLQSANELCLAAGEYVSGSVEKFVDLMNARVKELGLTDTHFNNPNGLPDKKHYTSAYDMAVIARTAMKNDTFRKVTATKMYTCPKTNKHKQTRIWPNHHQMLQAGKYPKYVYQYCTGGKTGFTRAAGNTLVTYAEKDGLELVCVVLKSTSPDNGEPNEYTDTTMLLNYGFEKYQKSVVSEDNSELEGMLFNTYGSYFDSKNSPVHLSGEASLVLPKGVKPSEAEQKISYLDNVELKEGDNVIGQVQYTYAGKIVGVSDIIYTKKTEDSNDSLDAASKKIVGEEIDELKEIQKKDEKNADFWRKVKNALETFFGFLAVKIVVILLFIGAIVFFIIRFHDRIHLPQINIRLPKRRRRDMRGSYRSSGGYRSKRAKRNYRRRQRGEKRSSRSELDSDRRRRNRRRHYETKSAVQPKEKKRKGVKYSKKHRNTKESFGKNFFDF